MAVEYCPDCGNAMSRIIGYVKEDAIVHAGEPIRACPSCGYQRDAHSVVHGSVFYDIASQEPPSSERRCPKCGAYTFNYPSAALGDDSKCRRCGYPSPFVKNQAQKASGQPIQGQAWQNRSGQAQSFSAPVQAEGRSTLNTVFGVITIFVAFSTLPILFGIYIRPSAAFFVPLWVVNDLIGVVGGFLSISGGKFGKLLRKIFWILLPILIVLALLLGI